MGQHQTPQDHNDQPDLDRTQPSLTRPRQLDWRPQDHQANGAEPPPMAHRTPRRRPPTEGAPTWVVVLGVAALLAVVLVLLLLFVASRETAQTQPTATAVIITPTATLVPRQTFTAPPPEIPTTEVEQVTAAAPAPPPDVIAVGGYVRVAAPSGLSFRDAASTGGAKLLVLDGNAHRFHWLDDDASGCRLSQISQVDDVAKVEQWGICRVQLVVEHALSAEHKPAVSLL